MNSLRVKMVVGVGVRTGKLTTLLLRQLEAFDF